MQQEKSNNDLCAKVRSTLVSTLTPSLAGVSSCALLNYPNHNNCGDCAIWMGQIHFLEDQKIDIAYTCTGLSYSAKDLVSKTSGPILMHGGGNFGDLWLSSQDFLLKVVQDFPDRPIIQLPQSIHFDDEKYLERCKKIINAHKNFTMFVRDTDSMNFFKKHFTAPCFLSPDTAFYLSLTRTSPSIDILWLGRTDKESAVSASAHLYKGVQFADWTDRSRTPKMTVVTALLILARLGTNMHWDALNRIASKWAASAFDGLAQYHLEYGINLLSRGKVVITDRLHGHILCLLLGIPHVMLDNSYGKISHFHTTWTKNATNCIFVETPEEALKQAKLMLASITVR